MEENIQFCEFLLLKIVNFWVSLSTGILNISFLKLVWKKINLGQHCTVSHLIVSQWDSKLKNIWHLGQSLFYMIKRIKSMNLVLNLRKKKLKLFPKRIASGRIWDQVAEWTCLWGLFQACLERCTCHVAWSKIYKYIFILYHLYAKHFNVLAYSEMHDMHIVARSNL